MRDLEQQQKEMCQRNAPTFVAPQKPSPRWAQTALDRAHRLCCRAIDYGWLSKAPCEVCAEPRVDAHHVNYSEPYNVRWLCRRHHGAADILRRRGIDYKRSLVIELARRSTKKPSPFMARINRAKMLENSILAFERFVMS